MITMQHKFEKIETAKLICGKCAHVWYLRLQKLDDFEVCPECETSAMAMRVEHILTKGTV